jgi:hypothetical protein
MTKITAIDVHSLSQLGAEAVALFAKRDFQGLADRFGYALAYDRDPAQAIAADLESSLLNSQEPPEQNVPSITVKYFKFNSSNLVALVECVMLFDSKVPILIELIVNSFDGGMYIYLEDVSPLWTT